MKTFLTAISTGFLGALAIAIAFPLHLHAWVLFLGWVACYIFGSNFKSIGQTILQISLGILLAVIIRETAAALAPKLNRFAFPLVVLVSITALVYLSKIKGLENIAAWFIGLIVFFGIQPELNRDSFFLIAISLLAGFVLGFSNKTLGQFINKNTSSITS